MTGPGRPKKHAVGQRFSPYRGVPGIESYGMEVEEAAATASIASNTEPDTILERMHESLEQLKKESEHTRNLLEDLKDSVADVKERKEGSSVTGDAVKANLRGMIHFSFNVSTFPQEQGEKLLSDVTPFGGVLWYFFMRKLDEHLAIYLHGKRDGPGIEFDSNMMFCLLGTKPIYKKGTLHVNKDDERFNRGYRDFISWADLTNPENGFVDEEGNALLIADFTVKDSSIVSIPKEGARFSYATNTSDCVLLVEGRQVYANKGILSEYSTALHTLIAGEHVGPVLLEGVNYDEFIQLLEVIYPPNAPITADNFAPVLKLACQLDVPTVLKKCEVLLIDSKVHSFVSKIRLSYSYQLVELKKHCFSLVKTLDDLKALRKEPDYELLDGQIVKQLLDNVFENE